MWKQWLVVCLMLCGSVSSVWAEDILYTITNAGSEDFTPVEVEVFVTDELGYTDTRQTRKEFLQAYLAEQVKALAATQYVEGMAEAERVREANRFENVDIH